MNDNFTDSGVAIVVVTATAQGTALDVTPLISGSLVQNQEISFSAFLSQGISCQ
ncbi:Uncharacterized protein dnm_009360 [Desulfonema magnum]|uniref:Uncharacterized protein n=1 Tax=Desulfonema magnum TaxID=45655 RepID=A0A975BGL8_9BACT|nr:Uncharacterized protein dnm_009360 [Desulfonema magnum]